MFNDYEHIEDYSYQELEIVVNEWWNSLNEEQKYLQLSPTFEMYILNSMKKHQKVRINYTNYEYDIYTDRKFRSEKINNILNG